MNESRWTTNSAKVFVAIAGALFALSAVVVICLTAFSAHRHKTVGPNGSVGVPVLPATKANTPAEKGNAGVTPLPSMNRGDNGTVAAEHPAIVQTPTPALNPIPTPGPVSQPESKAFTSDSEFLSGERPEIGLPGEESLDRTGSKNVKGQLPKSVRKNLEKERREAERKRSRLEDMYRKHLISAEAYKKGEKEYKSQIEKYRSELNSGESLPNSLE